jgi:hypothetical protein
VIFNLHIWPIDKPMELHMTDIENLTIKEARAIAAMFPAIQSSAAAEPKASTPAIERAVLVTTEQRGVFFGYATDTSGDVIHLRAARNCIYWPASNKGFLGLASDGPQKGSRVGPAADIDLRNITCVAAVSPDAVAVWESQPWAS